LTGEAKSELVKPLVRIFAGLTTLASLAAIYCALNGPFTSPPVDKSAFEESGKLLAEQALAHLESEGTITVITRDTSDFKNPASDIQLASFRKVIDHAHATIGEVRKLQVDPLRPIAVPSTDFCEALRNTPPRGVVVSFMGPPVISNADRAKLGSEIPAVIAFCSGNLPNLADLKLLFQQGLLQVAIVDRSASRQPSDQFPNLPNGSSQEFVTLTETNLSSALAVQGRPRK
jgi:predicted small lipoprotein YifL